jgi:integrase
MREPKKEKNGKPRSSPWQTTPVANLVRYEPSGAYYARLRVAGKLVWKKLDTDVFSVAKQRLPDFVKEQRQGVEREKEITAGKMTFGDALAIYKQRLAGNPKLKPGAKLYREKCIATLLDTWPGIEQIDIRKIRKDDCLSWAAKLTKPCKHAPKGYSPSVYNNTVGTLRQVLDLAIEKGALYNNVANAISKQKPRQKKLTLPTQKQFEAWVKQIRTAGAWCSQDCGDFVEFISYGGFRKGEAAHVTFADCDFQNDRIRVYGDPETRTKNGEFRTVPMIPEMKELLARIKERRGDVLPSSAVLNVNECQTAMDNARGRVEGMPRLTHHDLRHFFATKCIESGVDIPTVSRWLGHKDGGALAMKTYGHLRDEHSTAMAAKVSFRKPANVVELAKGAANE